MIANPTDNNHFNFPSDMMLDISYQGFDKRKNTGVMCNAGTWQNGSILSRLCLFDVGVDLYLAFKETNALRMRGCNYGYDKIGFIFWNVHSTQYI